MRKITIKDFRKYTEIIERLDEDLNREAFVEEFMVEAQLDKETAREIFSFIRDDDPVLEEDPNKYELIIRRGLGNNELKKLRIKIDPLGDLNWIDIIKRIRKEFERI